MRIIVLIGLGLLAGKAYADPNTINLIIPGFETQMQAQVKGNGETIILNYPTKYIAKIKHNPLRVVGSYDGELTEATCAKVSSDASSFQNSPSNLAEYYKNKIRNSNELTFDLNVVPFIGNEGRFNRAVLDSAQSQGALVSSIYVLNPIDFSKITVSITFSEQAISRKTGDLEALDSAFTNAFISQVEAVGRSSVVLRGYDFACDLASGEAKIKVNLVGEISGTNNSQEKYLIGSGEALLVAKALKRQSAYDDSKKNAVVSGFTITKLLMERGYLPTSHDVLKISQALLSRETYRYADFSEDEIRSVFDQMDNKYAATATLRFEE